MWKKVIFLNLVYLGCFNSCYPMGEVPTPKKMEFKYKLPNGKDYTVVVRNVYRLYTLLGVHENATLEEIKSAYHAKFKELSNAAYILSVPEKDRKKAHFLCLLHLVSPDCESLLGVNKNASNLDIFNAEVSKKKELYEAFKVLSNETSRKNYDFQELQKAKSFADLAYLNRTEPRLMPSMIESLDQGNLPAIQFYISEGFNVDDFITKTAWGRVTPLMYIAAMHLKQRIGEEKAYQIINFLIKNGANIALKNDLDYDVIDIIAHSTRDVPFIKKILASTSRATLQQMEREIPAEPTLWENNKLTFIKKALSDREKEISLEEKSISDIPVESD